MKRYLVFLAILVAYAAPATLALAADNTNGKPPETKNLPTKKGAIAGDPRGAIRALGGKIDNDFKPGGNTVDVPKLGGSVGVNHVGGAPPGVSGGR